MFWYFVDAFITLPLLYAIMATLIEFRFDRKRSFIIIVLAIGATLFMDLWKVMHGTSIADIYSQAWITTCIPSFLSLLYLAKYRDGSFVFAYLTEAVLASIATFLANFLSYLLPWESGVFPILFHLALLVGILLICRQLFGRNFFEAARIQGKRWILYCVLPLICIFLWVIYTGSSVHLTDIENKINLPYVGYINPRDIPVLIGLVVMVFYTVSLILIMITMTHHAEAQNREKMVLCFQSKALEVRLSSLEDKDESMRILRHDLRHHLSTLTGLMQNNAYVRAQEYINKLDHNLMKTKQESFCKNAVINAIISYYTEKAEREGIRFLVQVQISDDLHVDDLDLGAVMSNLLENAQNACMKQSVDCERFIDIKFIQHKKQYVLDISNSFDEPVEFDNEGRPVSKQKDHGIGTQSIFAFSRKYGASMDYSAKNGIFSIRILFTEAE